MACRLDQPGLTAVGDVDAGSSGGRHKRTTLVTGTITRTSLV
jgi:hypothetical protein